MTTLSKLAKLANRARAASPYRRQRRARGFTLLELMVVVTLVATLAMLAAPSFVEARRDRLAFDFAGRFQQLLVQGRARAAGTGSAHLALFGPGAKTRGYLRLYAALDGTAAANPISSCKQNPAQWDQAATDPIVVNGTTARFLDSVDLNADGVVSEMDLRATARSGAGTEGTALAASNFVAVCVAPSGATYVGSGATAAAAITAMRETPAFNGIVELSIQAQSSGSGVGMRRVLTFGGGAAPWLRSE